MFNYRALVALTNRWVIMGQVIVVIVDHFTLLPCLKIFFKKA